MATVLDGKAVSERRLGLLREMIDESSLHPRLATVLVGDDPASALYVRMKHQACERVHIGSINVTLPGDATTARVAETVQRLNEDPEISGILVQLPLPAEVDQEVVIGAVSPVKDVDGFHPCNLGRLFSGRPRFSPCTPAGIMTLLAEYRHRSGRPARCHHRPVDRRGTAYGRAPAERGRDGHGLPQPDRESGGCDP